jgi:hypothetical protein
MLVTLRLLLTLTFLLALPAQGYAQPARPVAVISLPFDLVGGLIVLRNLPLNDKQGDFVLDTGCAYGLVVEQAAFNGQLRPAPTRGLSSTGSVAQQQVSVRSFQLGSAHYSGLTAVATSLASIRQAIGPRLLGLVGYELLRDYEVVIELRPPAPELLPARAPGTPPV